MDGFVEIMNYVSFRPKLSPLTQAEAEELLKAVVEKLQLKDLSPNRNTDKCYGNDKYFVYIAGFPALHIGIDNKSGTDRKYSISTLAELDQIPS